MSSRDKSTLNSCFTAKRNWCGTVAMLLIAGLSECLSTARLAIAAGNVDPSRARSTIEYHRIYVPADKSDAWPRDGEKYIPIEAREFDALIQSANSAVSQHEGQAIIESADYSGQLPANGQLQGEARWKVSLRDGRAAFLPLTDTSLILHDVHWQDAPQEKVRVGYWSRDAEPSGRAAIQIKREGMLVFKWMIPTERRGEELLVPWRVPAANSIRLSLDLSPTQEPQIDRAVSISEKLPKLASSTQSKKLRRWAFALSPSTDAVRVINTRRKSSTAEPDVAVEESTRYDIDTRGLEITSIWQLDGAVDQKRELAVPLPNGLQLTAVRENDHELKWHIGPSAPGNPKLLAIELPNGLKTKPRQLTVKGWQPLTLNSAWRLPVLRPERVSWMSGKFELSVSSAFDLQRLGPNACVDIAVSGIKEKAESPESHAFAAYMPSASLEVTIAPRRPTTTVRTGSSLTLADPDLKGRLVTEWNVSGGSTHHLTGILAANWIIEAVETIPAEAMGEWFVDRRGREQHLELQLARAAAPGRDVTVIITGRLRFSLNETISSTTLKMIDWANARVSRHLLTFQSNEPYAVENVGHLPTFSGASLDKNDRSLVDSSSGKGSIFDLTGAQPNAGLQLTFRRGQYSAKFDISAIVANEQLECEYRIGVKPSSAPVDRILVYSTSALGDAHWYLGGNGEPIAAERLPADDLRNSSLPTEGELWLVRLVQPSTDQFDLIVRGRAKSTGDKLVPLFCCPEAIEQHGRVTLRCADQQTPLLETNALTPISLPLETSIAGKSLQAPMRAAFRYEPMQCRDRSRAPHLSLSPPRFTRPSATSILRLSLESFYYGDGRGMHKVTYQIENDTDSVLKLGLPPDASVLAASIDNYPIDLSSSNFNANTGALRVPAKAEGSAVSISFETEGRPLTAGHELPPPLNFNQLLFLFGDWTIHVPQEYSLASDGISAVDCQFNWRRRLFGPLGRASSSEPFNPISLVDAVSEFANDTTPQIETVARAIPLAADLDIDRSKDNPDLESPTVGTESLPGWQEFHVPLIADGPASVVIMHHDATGAWAVVTLIACFLLGRRLRRRQNEAFAVAAAIAACLVLILPIAYANLAAGAFIGLLLSFISDWARTSTFHTSPRNRHSDVVLVGSIVSAIALGITKANGAESATKDPATHPAASLYRVFIPVDANRQPTGSKYYVSERFLRTLIAAGQQAAKHQGDWLLTRASISGELRETSPRRDVAARNWTINIEIETLSRDTTVVLPLVLSEAQWNDTAMLDGIPLPLEWLDARRCAVKIAEPGQYSLSISFLPATTTNGGQNEIVLNLPPVRGTRFELRAPDNLGRVTLPGALVTSESNESKLISGELDETHRLRIQWPLRSAQQNSQPDAPITELRWLRIERAQVVLDVRYVLDGTSNSPDSLSVQLDDAWALRNADKTITETDSKSQRGMHIVRIPFSPGHQEYREARLKLQLRDPPALGNLRLPSIELSGTAPSQRWLAVSAGPSLACESFDSTASISTANEFFKKWGSEPEGEAPQLVLSNLTDRQPPISLHPRQTEPEIEESLSIAAGNRKLGILYDASVTPSSFGTTRLELSVPEELIVDDVTATTDSQQIPLRWSRPSGKRITVFFGETVEKNYRLKLRGQTPIDARGKSHVPLVTAAATEATTQQVRLYREDNVHVATEGLQPASELTSESTELPSADWHARPVMVSYVDKTTANGASITVRASVPQVTGTTLTTLFRESGTWSAEYRSRLKVEDGELDVLRIRIPNTWTGPFDVRSSVPVTSESRSDNPENGDLIIRFTASVRKGETVEVRIRGPLILPKTAATAVPTIVAEGVNPSAQFISVPEATDNQPTMWTQIGVQPAVLPQSLLATATAAVKAQIFQVTNPQFQVELKLQAQAQPSPQIRLADSTVIANQSGGQLITTRFVLAAQGLTECKLQLPSEQNLLAAKLDGRPASIASIDESTWQLTLGAAQLPQVIEIASRCSSGSQHVESRELKRPSLLAGDRPILIEFSLWSYSHPSDLIPILFADAAEVSAADQVALRFDRLVSIAEAAKVAAAELPAPDGYNWFLPWAKMLETEQNDARQSLTATRLEPTEIQVSRSSEEQIAHAADRLRKWVADCQKTLVHEGRDAPNNAPRTATVSASTTQFRLPDCEWAYFVAEGGNDTLRLQVRPKSLTATQARIIGLWFIVSSLIVTMIIIRWPAATDLFCRWPHVVGILLGIAWWAWLWPSWLGLVIVAISIWLALRSDWPGRAMRTEASTILRASRNS